MGLDLEKLEIAVAETLGEMTYPLKEASVIFVTRVDGKNYKISIEVKEIS